MTEGRGHDKFSSSAVVFLNLWALTSPYPPPQGHLTKEWGEGEAFATPRVVVFKMHPPAPPALILSKDFDLRTAGR
jgi:hypothetical protein